MTYMHEHLRIDLSGEKHDDDCLLDDFDAIKNELRDLKKSGLNRVVDMSCRGLGRDYDYLDKMEKETGLEVVISTGCYKDPFLPPEALEADENALAAIFIDDIEKGCEGRSRRARIIGEIGTSKDVMTDNEKKVFKAACKAHNKTGVPVSTHTTLGTLGFEQAKFLLERGVNHDKLIIGHLDLANSIETILRVLDRGVYIEFDTVGKIKYLPDETRIDFIKNCCDRGYAGQLLLSMDITRKSHLKKNGGPGYSYLIDNFLPRLREAGVCEADIKAMLEDNPQNILGPES